MACEVKKKVYDSYRRNNPKASAEEAKAIADDFSNLYTYEDGRLQMKYVAPKVEADKQDVITAGLVNMNKFASNLLAGSVLPTTLNFTAPIAEQIHEFAEKNVPMYDTTSQWLGRTWEKEKWIKEWLTFFSPGKMGDYGKFNKIMSMYTAATQDNIKRMDNDSKKMMNKFEKAYSTEEIAKFDDIIAKSGIFYLTHDDILSKLVKGETTIEDEIKALEAILSPGKVKQATNLAKVYLGKEIEDVPPSYNNSESNLLSNQKAELDALTSLKALAMIDNSQELLMDLYVKNNDLYSSIVGLAISTYALTQEILTFNGDTFKMRGNLIEDIPSVDYEILAVTEADLKSNEFTEAEGWKILRSPEKGKKFGLVYRENLQTMQDGMGVNISYIKNGIPIGRFDKTKEYTNDTDNSFVFAGDVKTLYLTDKEKKTLKYENNPVKSIMRSYAHKRLIIETQVIRDEFLGNMTKNYSRTSPEVINEELKAQIKTKEHPVFLHLGELSLAKAVEEGVISKEIANEYEAVGKGEDNILSDIGGFRDKVQYIRKDIGYYVAGYKEKLPFTNRNMNVMYSRTRDLIKWIKTNMIIVNPVKITMDFASGMALVAAKGASFSEIKDYAKEAVAFSGEMTDLRNKRILLQTEYSAARITDKVKASRLEKELRKVEEDIGKHPFSGALANGFINSLATEMLSKERESLKGLGVNIERVLDALTKDDKGEYTKFNEAIKRFARAGVNIEVIYEGINERLEGTKGEGAGKIFKEVAEDMASARSKEDMKDYISQFILAPNSHFVRLGSAATLYADLVPRWILYRHNINSGMSEADAAEDALTSLLDYKMNLPPSMKFMSDLYLMPFPTFFVRIQRVLLNLVSKNPASFASQLLASELSGMQGATIINSNIFNKWENDTIFTNTFDALKPGNLIPFSNAFYF